MKPPTTVSQIVSEHLKTFRNFYDAIKSEARTVAQQWDYKINSIGKLNYLNQRY